jgi:hypothetical protein
MGRDNPFILIKDRLENVQGLIDLKLDRQPAERMRYIASLDYLHACQLLQSDNEAEATQGRHLWVFGILVGKAKKLRPAYVKIQLGRTVADPICISFHRAMFPLKFLFPSPHSTAFQVAYDAQS